MRRVILGPFSAAVCCAVVFTLPAGALAAPSCISAPPDLASWWPADGDATDIAGGHDGTPLGGVAFVPGRVGEAFSFNGSNLVAVPDDPDFTFGNDPFTIDLWVNFDSVGLRNTFVSHDESWGTQNKWIFWYDGAGHRAPFGPALRFHINGPSIGGAVDTVVYPWSPTTGQWYHVAVTRSGSTYALYVDGVQVITESDTNTIPDAAAGLDIGEAEGSHLFDGLIDEVEIFNRALTPAEIEAIYGAGCAGKCRTGGSCGDGRLDSGEQCDDGNLANGDGCSATCAAEPGWGCACGACSPCGDDVVGPGEECDDGNTAGGDCCSSSCQFEAGPCEDGDICTDVDMCANGVCMSGPSVSCEDFDLCTQDTCDPYGPGCLHEPAPPAVGCRSAAKSLLLIRNKSDDTKDKLVWKWIKGLATSQEEFGDPLSSTDYALCVYAGTASVFLTGVTVPADAAKWSAISTKGFKYTDAAAAADGVRKIVLKGSTEDKAKALVKGMGANLPDPVLGDLLAPIRAQLITDDAAVCWEGIYEADDIRANASDLLKAKAVSP